MRHAFFSRSSGRPGVCRAQPTRRIRVAFAAVFLSAAMPLLSGCGVELAVLASASKAGADAVGKSKIKSAAAAEPEAVYQATRQAAAELGLTVVHDRVPQPDRYRLTLEDGRGTDLRVKIDGRAEHLTRVTVDFGLFGHDPTGRLFLNRLQAYLEPLIEADRLEGRGVPDPAEVTVPAFEPQPFTPDPYAL